MNDTGDGGQGADHLQLVDLVPYRFHPGVRSLLASALGGTEGIGQALDSYIDVRDRHLLGFLRERQPLALLGLEIIGRDTARILHLETAEPPFDAILGTRLLRQAIARFGLARLSASVDEGIVAFYGSLGFSAVRREAILPGGRRVECILEAPGASDGS